MADPQPVPLAENPSLFRAAEKLVSAAWGRPTIVTAAERLVEPRGSSQIYRCTAASGADPAGSFILKQAAGSLASAADRAAWEARRFCNDWLGAEFITALSPSAPLGPRFLGGDVAAGCFALEDLGEHRNLVAPLLHGQAAEAEAGLLKYATALGQLHAQSAGHAAAFSARFAMPFPGQQPYAEELDEQPDRQRTVQRLMSDLDVPLTGAVLSEIAAVMSAAAEPGPFLAYIHCDPCPDNLFDQGAGYRFIDFEWGHFGHALLDAVYPRLLWPSCWCSNRLPAAVLTRVEQTYRAELSRSCPAAQNDAVWDLGLAHAGALTLLNRLAWDLEPALAADRTRGLITIRQRMLALLEAFVEICETTRTLPALRGVAEKLLERLHPRWADTPPPPLYPAFAA